MSEDIAETSTQAESLWYARRVDGPRLPFMPYGLVPLIGFALLLLFSVFVFAPYAVEAPTRLAAERVAAERDASWARINVSGQQVTLSGEAPTTSEGNALTAAVRSARASTPFGLARPASPVIANFTVAPDDEAATETIAPTEPVARGRRVLSPDWTFNLTSGVLTLSGGVPDEDTRDAIVEAAREAINPPRLETVEDELIVTGVAAPDGYAEMAARGVETVLSCERGEAAFKFERFSLRCEVSEANAAAVEAAASAAPALGELGPIIVMESEAVTSCETGLAALLGDARIQFAPASAEISTSSTILLDAIASRVRACPGTLRIEGHTDSTADSAFNADLSLRRAEAVREQLIARNVPADRLVAEGLGERRPVASNDTVDGRALNRRIEVRVVRPPVRESDE